MKTCLTTFLLLFACGVVSAQTTTTEPVLAAFVQKIQPQPLCIIYSHNKIVARTDTASLSFDKKYSADIESINVLKDASAVKKYGDEGKNSVIEIYLKDSAVFTKDMIHGK